jgi:hypothetical protein
LKNGAARGAAGPGSAGASPSRHAGPRFPSRPAGAAGPRFPSRPFCGGIPIPRCEGGTKPPPSRPPAPLVGFSRPVRTIQVGRARLRFGRARLPPSRAQRELRPPALLGRDSHLGPVALGIPIPPAGGRDSPGRANEKEFSFERHWPASAGRSLPPASSRWCPATHNLSCFPSPRQPASAGFPNTPGCR